MHEHDTVTIQNIQLAPSIMVLDKRVFQLFYYQNMNQCTADRISNGLKIAFYGITAPNGGVSDVAVVCREKVQCFKRSILFDNLNKSFKFMSDLNCTET